MNVKNFMKGTLMLSILVISSVAFAQQQGTMPPKTPEERAEHQTQWMRKNLHLTRDQGEKVYSIMLYYAQQADNAKGMRPGPEKKAERQGINRDKNTDLRAVLTGEQYDKYQQHEGAMKEKRKERAMVGR